MSIDRARVNVGLVIVLVSGLLLAFFGQTVYVKIHAASRYNNGYQAGYMAAADKYRPPKPQGLAVVEAKNTDGSKLTDEGVVSYKCAVGSTDWILQPNFNGNLNGSWVSTHLQDNKFMIA